MFFGLICHFVAAEAERQIYPEERDFFVCNQNLKCGNCVMISVSVDFPSQVQEFKMAFCVRS